MKNRVLKFVLAEFLPLSTSLEYILGLHKTCSQHGETQHLLRVRTIKLRQTGALYEVEILPK